MFSIWSILQTITQYTPSQLVFSGDVNQEANWQLIKQHEHVSLNKDNQKENHSRQSHVYHTGDKVLLMNAWKTKFNQDSYLGTDTVTEIQNNGMVYAHRGNLAETFNVQNITPFKE